MSEARNVIILILVLLFIFVGVGVAISRLGKSAISGNKEDRGFLQRIFYDIADSNATPSAKVNTVTPTPADTAYAFATPTTKVMAPATTKPTSGMQQSGVQTPTNQTGVSTQKGGAAEEIPATGTPTAAILFALGGLAAGIKLYKKA